MDSQVPSDIAEIATKGECSGGVDEKTIHVAEIALGIKFPPEYRAFQSAFGAVNFPGFFIYGLTRKEQGQVSEWVDVRDEIVALRRLGISRELIPISHDGTEFYFYLLAESSGAGQAQSVIVLGPDRENVQVAQSFFGFLRRAAANGGVYDLVGD